MLRLLLTPARRPSRHTVCIDCQVVRERDFRLVADRIENLSATGLLAGPADPVLTGERLIVSFRLPRSGVWIDSEGVVSRVVHGRRKGDFGRSLGIEFTDMDMAARRVLERHLSRFPPVPPRGGRRPLDAAAVLRLLTRLGKTPIPMAC